MMSFTLFGMVTVMSLMLSMSLFVKLLQFPVPGRRKIQSCKRSFCFGKSNCELR